MSDKSTVLGRAMDPTTHRGQMMRIAVSRLGAEATNITCSFVGLMVAERVLRDQLEPLREFVTTHIVLPNLSLFEQAGRALPSLQTPDDTKALEALTPEKRAYSYADAIVNMSCAITGGFVGQIGGQMLFDHLTSVPNIGAKNHVKVAMVDRTAQLGVILGLNTIFAKPSIDAQKKIESLLQKTLGMDETEARTKADLLINWQVPNVVGALAAVVGHFHYSRPMKW